VRERKTNKNVLHLFDLESKSKIFVKFEISCFFREMVEIIGTHLTTLASLTSLRKIQIWLGW
jgi:hypothetical protein